MPTTPSHSLQCLEVWGGNAATDNGVVMPGLDAWVFSRPFHGDASGGDVHYLSSCATGRIVRVLVADVSGHGEAVSRTADDLRAMMRRYVNIVDQTDVLRAINREFTDLSQVGTFATALVATYWTPTDRVVICNAGHPRPIRYRAARRTWEFLQSGAPADAEVTNIPLGIADARYDQFELRLGRDDLLLFYTDSLTEARPPGGRQLGESGLIEIARSIPVADPNGFVRELLAGIESHAGGRGPEDDLTVLLVRPNAFKPRGSLATGVKAGLRMGGRLARSMLPGSERFPWPELSATNLMGAFFDRWNRGPKA